MPLNVAESVRGDRRVLVVAGELDLDSAVVLVEAAQALAEAGQPDIVIDARELDFCDSSGLSAFVRIANQASTAGGRLAIAGPQPIVSRVLEISGLVEAFLVTGSVAEALTALARPRAS